jgi:phospholipid/cholesterol/gamma-HCH transport system substrate-binding protein
MHYIHTLTPGQKKGAIAAFISVPLVILALLLILWANNQGLFKPMISLKTIVSSAKGVNTQTPVTLSGFTVGNITQIRLVDQNSIELTLRVDMKYAEWIRKDSTAVLMAQNIIGTKEILIRGGSKDSPPIHDGDTLRIEEYSEADNLMNRVNPIIGSVERIMQKLDKIFASFPNDRMNASVTDISGILSDIRQGKATVGKLLSTDNGALYDKIDGLLAKLNDISQKVDAAAAKLPETMDNVTDASNSAKTAAKGLPEMQQTLHQVLKNLNRVLDDLSAMTPEIRKTVMHVGDMAQDVSKTTPRLPALMDDVERTLGETLIIVQSLKASWPVKNLVPKEEEKTFIDPAQRQSPYAPVPEAR